MSAVNGFGAAGTTPISLQVQVIAKPNAAPSVVSYWNGTLDRVTGQAAGFVPATDPEGDRLSWSGPVSSSKGGTVSVTADGWFTYTPPIRTRDEMHQGYSDTFDLFVADEYGGKTKAPVTVSIAALNRPPVVTKTSLDPPNSATGVVTGKVTATDEDGDPTYYRSPGYTSRGGTVSVATDGSFTYTAPPRTTAQKHMTYTDSFTVLVYDAYGYATPTQAPVTVSIPALNRAPGLVWIATDTPNAVTGVVTGKVTANDADGDPLTYSSPVVTGKGGTVSVGPDGKFTYTAPSRTPTEMHRIYSDSFKVKVSDGYGGSVETPAITVSIPGLNRAPVVTTTDVGNPNAETGLVTGTVTATDPDGDSLVFSRTTVPTKGTVVVGAGGGFTYTPSDDGRHNASADGANDADKTDTFTVTVDDGHGGSTPAPVRVTIQPNNVAPVGFTEFGSPNPETGVVLGTVSASDADHDELSYERPVTTAKGTIVWAANGIFTYTPTLEARQAAVLNPDDPAATHDTFTVTVSDGHGGSVEVPVGVSIAPAYVEP